MFSINILLIFFKMQLLKNNKYLESPMNLIPHLRNFIAFKIRRLFSIVD